jgi:hypothetical protein
MTPEEYRRQFCRKPISTINVVEDENGLVRSTIAAGNSLLASNQEVVNQGGYDYDGNEEWRQFMARVGRL